MEGFQEARPDATTCESWGELEKAVETLACGSCSDNISRFPKLSLMFYNLRETWNMFSIS